MRFSTPSRVAFRDFRAEQRIAKIDAELVRLREQSREIDLRILRRERTELAHRIANACGADMTLCRVQLQRVCREIRALMTGGRARVY